MTYRSPKQFPFTCSRGAAADDRRWTGALPLGIPLLLIGFLLGGCGKSEYDSRLEQRVQELRSQASAESSESDAADSDDGENGAESDTGQTDDADSADDDQDANGSESDDEGAEEEDRSSQS